MAKLHDSVELLWPLLFSAAPLEAMLQNEAQHGHKTFDAETAEMWLKEQS